MHWQLLRMLAAGALIALLIGQAVAAVEAGGTFVAILWFAAIFAVAGGYAILEMRARR
jgi:hypothetical protein